MGWQPGQPMSVAQAHEFLLAGKQVTVDFTAAGTLARVLNQIAPFFNSHIQGPVAHARALRRDPAKFLWRGLQGTAVALALWWRYRDEEWWQELSAKEKYLYTYVPFSYPDKHGDTRSELLRIPRAFEADGLFMAGAQTLADAWYREDPQAAAEWFQTFVATSTPNPLPVLVDEAADQLANFDYFTDRPIVPLREEGMFAAEQAGPFTSNLAVWLGRRFDVSPRRIDHAIRGTFGGVGSDLVSLLGLHDDADRQRELADIPVLGTLFQRGGQGARSPKSVDAFYERLDHARKLQRSDEREETDHQRDMRLLLLDAQRAMTALWQIERATEKVEDRRAVRRRITDIAREAVRRHDEDDASRESFEEWIDLQPPLTRIN